VTTASKRKNPSSRDRAGRVRDIDEDRWGSSGQVTGGVVKENTWNARLTAALVAKGYPSADFELHFPILHGRPRKPDVAFANGGTHLVSGKLGAKNEFDAFSSAQEYQQLIGATTALGEVFAVIYPESAKEGFIIHLLANADHERTTWKVSREAGLPAVVDLLDEAIQDRIDLLKNPPEPADATVVRLLRQGVDILFADLRGASEERLKEVFGGVAFFDSVLASAVPTGEIRPVLSTAAAFLFVNQLLFYSILARETNLYEQIDPAEMSSPHLIRSKYFAKVLERDYRPIFEIDVASLFDSQRSADGCLRTTRLIQEMARSVSTHDLVGKVFHEIIPRGFRKKVAAYYTNSAAGDLIAALTIDDPEASVMDPACGSGTLLVSAYHRKRALLPNAGASNTAADLAVHRRFVEEQITGLDVMAFSAHLAAVQLLLQEPLNYTEQLRIGTLDSTQAEVGLPVKPFGLTIKDAFRQRKLTDFKEGRHLVRPHESVKTGVVSVGKHAPGTFFLDSVDTLLMNPPFTSSRNMGEDYKVGLKETFRGDPRYEPVVRGNIGYHAYFLCLADKFLRPDGRLGAVIPFNTLTGGDFGALTRFLVTEYEIEYIVRGRGRSAFSENTMLAEILLVARKHKPGANARTVLVLTNDSPLDWTTEEVHGIAESARKARAEDVKVESQYCTCVPFPQVDLLPERRTLTQIVASATGKEPGLEERMNRLLTGTTMIIPLADLVAAGRLRMKTAEVVHGRSGDNPGSSLGRFGGEAIIVHRTKERTHFKRDRMVFETHSGRSTVVRDRLTGDTFSVPDDHLGGALRTFASIDRIDITGREDLAISAPYPGFDALLKAVLGKDAARKARAAIGQDWARVLREGSARVCLLGQVDLTAPGTRLLAVRSEKPFFMCTFMWGLHLANPEEEKALALWLNSTPFLFALLSRMTITRGSYVKLHGKKIGRLPVLDLRSIPPATMMALSGTYDGFKGVVWAALEEQYASPPKERRELDAAILDAVGVTPREYERLLPSLYRAITDQMKAMKATMDAD
jgi:hypothetical protein